MWVPVRAGLLLLAAFAFAPVDGWAQIEEIIVTVRKKEESLQNVPIAVTTFSAETIERKGIRNISDVARLTPSIQFKESFAQSDTRIAVRGLSPTRGRQNVALLVDGIDVSSEAISSSGGSLLLNTRLVDVERIEVVLGPQMALYGRSAFNGAIQYVTKDPAEEFETDFTADVAENNRYNVTAGVSAPIFGDDLGFRLNGAWWDEYGFYDNSITRQRIGGDKGFGLALTLKSEVGDNLSFKFRAEHTDDEGQPSPQVYLPFNTERAVPLAATEFTMADGAPVDGAGIAECFNGQNGKADYIDAVSNLSFVTDPLGGQMNVNDANLQARSDRIMDPNFTDGVAGSTLDNFLIDQGYAQGVDGGNADPPPTAGISPYCEWVVPLRVGAVPDGGSLPVALAPNPSTPGQDYQGFDRELSRLSLIIDWDISDQWVFTSLTGLTHDETTEGQDAGAFGFRSPDAGVYLDGNVNTFSVGNFRETDQFSQEIRFQSNLDGPFNGAFGALYWEEKVDNRSKAITAESSGSHCWWNSNTGGIVTGIDDSCTGYTETPVAPYQNAAAPFRPDSPSDRDTEHWSLYGLVDFELSDSWTLGFEGRYNNEDVKVEGPMFFDPGASGGPGGLNPCGIFFRGCIPFDQWETGDPSDPSNPGQWFSDQFFPYTDEDLNRQKFSPPEFRIDQDLLDQIPQECWPGSHADISTAPAAIQKSFNEGPYQIEYTTVPNSEGDIVPVIAAGGQTVPIVNANNQYERNPNATDMFNPWCVGSLEDSDSWFSPKVNLDWQITDDALAYFSWSRARKPGGFSLLTVGSSGLDRDLSEFEPEKMEVWEVGGKTAWLESTLIANGAFFFQDFTDKQALTSALGNDGRLVSKIENAGSAEVWGAELALTWSPITEFIGGNWTLSGAYTWLDAKYTDFTVLSGSSTNAAAAGNCVPTQVGSDTLCTLSYTGNKLEDAPDGAFNGFVNYTIPMTGEVDAYVESDFIWQAKRYANIDNNLWTKPFWVVDFRLGVRSERWEALLYAENLFDDDTIRFTGGGPGLNCCFVLGSSIDQNAEQTGDYRDAVPTEPVNQNNPPQSAGANVMVDLPNFSSGFLPPPRLVGFRLAYRFGN